MSRPYSPKIALSLVMLLGTAGVAPAELQFVQPTVDVGVIKSGAKLTHRFEFRNTGQQPVEIIDAKASCGCLRPRFPTEVIPPTVRGAIDVDFNTLSQPPGKSSWSVRVAYKVGDEVKQTTLQVQAELVCEVSAFPAALQMFTSQTLSADIKVVDRRPKPLTITSIQCSSPLIRTDLSGAAADGPHREYAVRVMLTEDYPEGRYEELVSIHTNDPEYQELVIPVIVVKTSRLRVSANPGVVVMRAVRSNPIPSRIVLLRDDEKQPVVIDKVTVGHKAIGVSWAKGPGAMATLKIRIDYHRLPDSGLRSFVQVEISHPVQEIISIPVECRIEPSALNHGSGSSRQ